MSKDWPKDALFQFGDAVRKKPGGSEWVGRVCGWYSTPLTPIGYAVESFLMRHAVQIYPEHALEPNPLPPYSPAPKPKKPVARRK